MMFGWLAVSGKRPAEALNDSGHGIEPVQPAPALRNQAAGICHGRGKQPELYQERDHVAHVTVNGIQGGEPQSNAQRGQNRQQQEAGKKQNGGARHNAVVSHHPQEHHKGDAKIQQA